MIAPVFVDTNVFVYARHAGEPLKQPVAAQWLERLWIEQSGRTSMQILSECYVTLTRKIRPPLAPEEAWDYVRTLLAWDVQPVDADLARRAREIESRYRLSWWDSLVVAAAQAQGCGLLLSEDLQDRAVYGGVTVRDPFKLAVSEAPTAYAAPTAARRHRPRGRPERATGA